MKPLRELLEDISYDEANEHAHAFHKAVGKYLANRQNFEKTLKNVDKSTTSRPLYNIPVRDLDVPKDIKAKYPNFHTVKIGPPVPSETAGGGTDAGHVGGSRDTKRRFGFLPGKKGSHLAITDFHHLNPNSVQNNDHGFLHGHTVNDWNGNFRTFRHEFEHVVQRHGKVSIRPVTNNVAGYRNSWHEAEAETAVFHSALTAAHAAKPENFAHIDPSDTSGRSMKEVVRAVARTGHQLKDEHMKSVVGIYNRFDPANRQDMLAVAADHVAKNQSVYKQHNDLYKAASVRPSMLGHNKPGSSWSGMYPPEGAPGFKSNRPPPNYHSPEGVMDYFAKDEAHRQVQNYVEYAPESLHGLEVPVRRTTPSARIVKGRTLDIENQASDYDHSPHKVAKFLNAMAARRPDIAKEFNHSPINYHTNKASEDEDEEYYKTLRDVVPNKTK